MKYYYRLTYDVSRTQMTVIDYDYMGFDLTTFWHGVPYSGLIPSGIRLYANAGKPIVPDYLSNPISWPICSERLVNVLQQRSTDFQLFDAPLFDSKTKKPLGGYKVVNITRLISCLDFKRSNISFTDDKKRIISVIDPVFIEEKIPDDAHIFRVVEDVYSVIISSELAGDLARYNIIGIALIECKAL